MFRTCVFDEKGLTNPGEFFEYHVVTKCGTPFHNLEDFLEHFAEKIMEDYESRFPAGTTTLEVDSNLLESPSSTTKFYRRLFSEKAEPTRDFITAATETLSKWIEC